MHILHSSTSAGLASGSRRPQAGTEEERPRIQNCDDAADTSAPPFGRGFAEDVEACIRNAFRGDGERDRSDPVHLAYLHHFRAKGGGVRVQLTQQCASILKVKQRDARCLAAAVEALHNASLVQDDLQDASLHRRGQPSVFAEFGRDVALGLTNRLITTAFACLAEIEEPVALGRMIRRLNAAVAETVSGQTSELTRKAHEEPSVESCIAAARQKSGPLFALALELPLIMAGQEKHVGTAHRVACLLGLGYQMLDDLKDQTPDSAHASSGNLVLAMRRANPARSAEQAVASLARTCLSDAIKEAEKLPGGMGRPLIEWTQSLFPRINTFT